MSSERLKLNNIITLKLKDIEGNIVKKVSKKNLVTTIGFRLVLDALGNDKSGITYGAVGTGTTAAAVSDTTLETELDRNGSIYTRSQTVGTFSVFFNTGEANGIITEIGFFGDDATTTSDSGTLFNHIILDSSITKTTDYTLTLDLDITVT